MKKIITVFLSMLAAISLSACRAKTAEKILSSMTTEQKIGQLFCVSFSGTELSEEVSAFFEEYCIGNVILFSKNIESAEQTALLCEAIQEQVTENTRVPAFIGADQEGGQVMRVNEGAEYYPCAMAVASCGGEDTARQLGAYMGEELCALGINIDFAPVADVNSNPDNPVIGTRSYGDNPKDAAKYALAMAEGLKSSGCVSVAKHYPGHGDTDIDSHYGLPKNDKSLDEIMETELVPFSQLIENGVPAIMAAHIIYPQLDPDYPASMSKVMLTDVLRKKLGFDGMIVTDSMRMGAVSDNFDMPKACITAIKAGADMIITGSGGDAEDISPKVQADCIEAVREAVYSGEISEEALNDAVLRVLRCKLEYRADKPKFTPLDETVLEEHRSFSREISEKSIAVSGDIYPQSGEKILYIAPEGEISEIIEEETSEEYLKIPDSESETDNFLENCRKIAADYDAVVVFADRKRHAKIINVCAEKNPRTIAVILGSPYIMKTVSDCGAVFAYEHTPNSARAAADVVFGKTEPQGKLPVSW